MSMSGHDLTCLSPPPYKGILLREFLTHEHSPFHRFLPTRFAREGMMHPVSVLLVDDNPAFLRIATRFLQEQGHDEVVVVGAAGGGEEGLIQAQEQRPDIVLVDLRMPGLSGLETIPLLRSMLPDVGIIALTLWDANGYREAALAAGADDLISKFVVNTVLLPAIRRVARSKGSQEKPVRKVEEVSR